MAPARDMEPPFGRVTFYIIITHLIVGKRGQNFNREQFSPNLSGGPFYRRGSQGSGKIGQGVKRPNAYTSQTSKIEKAAMERSLSNRGLSNENHFFVGSPVFLSRFCDHFAVHATSGERNGLEPLFFDEHSAPCALSVRAAIEPIESGCQLLQGRRETANLDNGMFR